MKGALTTLALFALVACTPALNWREVHLGPVRAMLPCKPDSAERPIRLLNHTAPLAVRGCEADGALFALSLWRAPPGEPAEPYAMAWKQHVIGNMHSPTEYAWDTLTPRGNLRVLHHTAVRGHSAHGEPIEARLLWLQSDDHLFHVAVYGTVLDEEKLGMLTTNLALSAAPAP